MSKEELHINNMPIKSYIKANYVEKKKIEKNIKELEEEIEQLRIDKNVTYDSGIYKLRLKIEAYQELLEK